MADDADPEPAVTDTQMWVLVNAVAVPASEMRPRVVDDVQVSCYYQKVPRVKSGLPVYGCLIGWVVCAGIRLRENLG